MGICFFKHLAVGNCVEYDTEDVQFIDGDALYAALKNTQDMTGPVKVYHCTKKADSKEKVAHNIILLSSTHSDLCIKMDIVRMFVVNGDVI